MEKIINYNSQVAKSEFAFCVKNVGVVGFDDMEGNSFVLSFDVNSHILVRIGEWLLEQKGEVAYLKRDAYRNTGKKIEINFQQGEVDLIIIYPNKNNKCVKEVYNNVELLTLKSNMVVLTQQDDNQYNKKSEDFKEERDVMVRKGMFIGERYEILDIVGSGGMADVYKAKDHILNRFVAVKIFNSEFCKDNNFVSVIKIEAQSVEKLTHPNIVNVYDVGEAQGIYYIVMELIEGITLKKYIEKKGKLPIKDAISIAIQVAQGIEAAHNNHIVHRDIKPHNIIVSREGKVKVTDFGIARAASANTIYSNAMGSVHYISPEQARGGYIDEKSDIYSLGITIYEMITGRVPFDGDSTVTIALQHIQEEIPSAKMFVPKLPVSVEKIIEKCAQKKPERRYLNITSLTSDLKKSLISPDEDFVVIASVSKNETSGDMNYNIKVSNDTKCTVEKKGGENMSGKMIICDNCKIMFVEPHSNNCPHCGGRLINSLEKMEDLIKDGFEWDLVRAVKLHIEKEKKESSRGLEEIQQKNLTLIEENKKLRELLKVDKLDLNKPIMDYLEEIKAKDQKVSKEVLDKEKEIKKLEEKTLELNDKKKELETECDNKLKDINSMKNECENLQKELKALQDEGIIMQEKYEKLKEQYKEGEEVNDKIKNQLEEQKNEMDKVKAEKEKYISLLEVQELDCEKVQKELKNLKSQLRYDEETVKLIEGEDFLKSPSMKESIDIIHMELENVEKKLARIICIKEKINDTIQDAVIQIGNGTIDTSDEVGGKL